MQTAYNYKTDLCLMFLKKLKVKHELLYFLKYR